jgi:hypothetical protein
MVLEHDPVRGGKELSSGVVAWSAEQGPGVHP